MGLGRKVAITAGIGLAMALAGSMPVRALDQHSPQAAFATWKAAHPNVDAEIADLKVKTASMIKAYGPFPADPQSSKYADLAARSVALSPHDKEQAQQFFAEGYSRWEYRDLAGAKKILAKGLEIDPANGMGNFYMGDVLQRLGDNEGAAVSMARAKALASNSPYGVKAAAAWAEIPVPVTEEPTVDQPPVIWRVSDAIGEIWESADAPEMLVIPAGEYTMGSPLSEAGRDENESPRHRVRIAYPLAVGKYPITVGQYEKFVAETHNNGPDVCKNFENGSYGNVGSVGWAHPGFSQDKNSPVVCISWQEAEDYTVWLSKKTGHAYRLLSESEYEYVTRAGTTTTYWWGDDAGAACGLVNSADLDFKTAERQIDFAKVSDCHDGFAFTAPVNSFKPNPFGLYGISGNSLSFVQDCWANSYNGAPTDGSAHEGKENCGRMVRGGDWADNASGLRSAYRGWGHDWVRYNIFGFRVARTL